MKPQDHKIPTNKRGATIFVVFMILLSINMIISAAFSLFHDSVPDDLVEISCSFQDYEIERNRSTAYDLLLISEAHELPFEFSFFDGYGKQFHPENFCNGSTYTLQVVPLKSKYKIYSCSNAERTIILTKREAYLNSQGMACVIVIAFFIASICFWGIMLWAMYCPEQFSDRIKKLFFGRKKSVEEYVYEGQKREKMR